jgi:isopentenyldiphosphate isomerase
MAEADEILDLVDRNNQVIGEVRRGDTPKLVTGELKGYIRATNVFLMNNQGKLWVPIRTLDKTIAPGGADFACSEHVGKGETYKNAAIRGFEEELNLTVTAADLELVGMLEPLEKEGVYYFCETYLYRSNTAPDFNHKDFMSASWMTPAELQAKIEAGMAAKSSIVPTLLLLQKTLDREKN